MNKPVIVIGGGGHARVLLTALRRLAVEVLGVVDPGLAMAADCNGYPVLGGDDSVLCFDSGEILLVNGIGSLPGDKGARAALFADFVRRGYRFRAVVDPQAYIAEDARLAEGVQVMPGVIIQAGTKIAENCIVNSGAIIEHDCRLEAHCHVAPGATLCGNVRLGEAVHVGAGAVIIQGVTVGEHSVIGAGAVVTSDVASRQIVYPARSQIRDL